MRPWTALERHRDAVRDAMRRFWATNARMVGLVLHATDRNGSDLDLLVYALPGATLFDLSALQVELEEMLGLPVDALTPGTLPSKVRQSVLAEAKPV